MVEDKLQDEVPETLQALQDADIKVWMLTGDKLETAQSIGFSCKLLSEGMDILKCATLEDLRATFNEEQSSNNETLRGQGKKRALIIEAGALRHMIGDEFPETKLWFLKMSRTFHSVICARVSPSQKAEVVRMVKRDDPSIVSLAIGDGANDVSMILQADIGVGIFGKEGNRAVDSSDFAISQFRFLWFLLFKHGRWNYKRFAMMLNYYFYKNFVYTFMQIPYAIHNGFSMKTVFADEFLTLFNLIFTALPIQWYAVSEIDVNASEQKDGAAYRRYIPSLYFAGQRNLQYNSFVTILWLSTGTLQAVIIYSVPHYALHGSILSSAGEPCEDQIMGLCMFTSLLFVVTNKLAINHQHMDVFALAFYFLSAVAVYFLYLWFVDDKPSLAATHFTFSRSLTSGVYYLNLLLVTVVCLVIDLILLSLSKFVYTDTRDVVREHILLKGSQQIDAALDLKWRRKVEQQSDLALAEDRYTEEVIDEARASRFKHLMEVQRAHKLREAKQHEASLADRRSALQSSESQEARPVARANARVANRYQILRKGNEILQSITTRNQDPAQRLL